MAVHAAENRFRAIKMHSFSPDPLIRFWRTAFFAAIYVHFRVNLIEHCCTHDGAMALTKRVLVTSALPYIDGVSISKSRGLDASADVFARFQRQRLGAQNVLFICATTTPKCTQSRFGYRAWGANYSSAYRRCAARIGQSAIQLCLP